MKNNGFLGSVAATIFVLLCFSVMILLIFLNISDRHSINENGEVLVAKHIRFPSYVTHYKPADSINLSESKISIGDTTINKELGAFIALQGIGWCDSTYHTELIDSHYFAISPEYSWDVWSWRTCHYRIEKWKLE